MICARQLCRSEMQIAENSTIPSRRLKKFDDKTALVSQLQGSERAATSKLLPVLVALCRVDRLFSDFYSLHDAETDKSLQYASLVVSHHIARNLTYFRRADVAR